MKNDKPNPNVGNPLKVVVHPVTAARWPDLEKLFGERGACGGCWCMLWRLKRSQYEKQKGEKNRQALRKIVESGEAPGLLAYAGGEPIGWCALAPRETYPALDRSRVLQRSDDKPVWSVACLFIAKAFRRKGVSVQLLKAAIQHVGKRGGKIVEGYPQDPKKDPMPDVFAHTGIVGAFREAGFTEQLRRSPTRPIMRCEIGSKWKRSRAEVLASGQH
jgi:GNAT superfamily N-acetyltransferase